MAFIATKQDVNDFKAFGETVIIETKAAKAGEELTSDSGFVLGKRETGEIPLTGIVVAIGDKVVGIGLGDIVLLPNGRMDHCPDPRYLSGEIDSTKQRQLTTTHYANIRVVFNKIG